MKITIDNKCPSCGANVKFNPTTQKWDCEYCGNSYEIGEVEKQQEKETRENLDFEIDEYTCPIVVQQLLQMLILLQHIVYIVEILQL